MQLINASDRGRLGEVGEVREVRIP